MNYTVVSDIGKRRSVNEDRAAFFERSNEIRMAVLADGMGGHNAGDVASEMAVRYFEKVFLEESEEAFVSEQQARAWLEEHVKKINLDMYQFSLTNESCQGMGTTLIVVLIIQNQLLISHVGDSRVYTFTNDGTTLITRDHSYVNMLLELGEINEEEAQNHPRKNAILKAIGTENTIEPDYYSVTIEQPMYLLICSDGLSNKVNENEMASILSNSHSIQEKGKQLLQLANDRGGEDNISIILVYFDGQVVE